MKRYVLTGGPSSGKSSLLFGIEKLYGAAIIHEAAEDVIKYSQAMGDAEPWISEDFQDRVLRLQLQRERHVAKSLPEQVFIDRGIIDGLAYFQIAKRETSFELESAMVNLARNPYDKIFLIENLGNCRTNQVRRENLDEALLLERLQEENYLAQGYEVVRIGPAPLGKRIQMLMAELHS
jgi:predicted ATPase